MHKVVEYLYQVIIGIGVVLLVITLAELGETIGIIMYFLSGGIIAFGLILYLAARYLAGRRAKIQGSSSLPDVTL